MNKGNKRIINIRPLFVVFLGFILGILFVTRFYNKKSYNNIVLLCIIGCIALWCIIMMILYLFANKNKYVLPATILLICILLGAGYTQLKAYLYKSNVVEMDDVLVTGKISEKTSSWLTLDNIKVIDNQDKEYTLSSKINVYVGNDNEVIENDSRVIGNVINFSCDLQPLDFIDKNMSYIASGINYLVFPSTTLSVVDYNPDFRDKSYNYIKNTLAKVDIPQDIQGVELAMLFGDKSEIGDMYNMFTRTGTGHILAVSGLHIMCLVFALSYFCKLIGIKRYYKLAVLGVILVLYNILCGFSPSVVRATLMAVCTILGKDIFGTMYDVTSSISLAGSIIILFSPFMIFDVGFILSFLCVFTIITLAPYITKIFEYMHLPQFLANSLGISCAISIGIFPMSCQYFTSVSFVSLIANVVVIPLFTLVYIVLFACLILVCILPFAYWLLYVPYALILALVFIVSLYSKLEFLILYTRPISINGFILLFALMISIKFLIVSIPIKSILCTILALLFLVTVVERYWTIYDKNNNMLLANDIVVFQIDNKYYMIISDLESAQASFDFMTNKYINNLDTIILLDYDDSEYQIVYDISKYFFVNNIIVPEDIGHTKIAQANVKYQSELIKYYSGGAILNIGDKTICVLDDNCTALDVDYFAKFSYNYLIMAKVNNFSTNITATKYISIAPFDPRKVINEYDKYDFVSTIFYPNGVQITL